MKVVVLSPDLIITSRIVEAGARAGADVVRVEAPAELPSPASVHLVLVDWASRAPTWADLLPRWSAQAMSHKPRIVLFGPHTDLAAHAEAKAAGLGPMLARSKLLADLPALLSADA